MKFLWLFLSLVGLSTSAHAELPPEAYQKMQAGAPEVIEIKVELVKHQHLFRRQEFVSAVVTKVTKSGSKLKVGDKITIKYRHVPLGRSVGPSPIPQLDKGKTYPAWLRKSGDGHYEPAARGMSFEKIDKR
ncbi:hypothetical protein V2O64_12775 [Verrucomicrobiaceae bacterium 227]